MDASAKDKSRPASIPRDLMEKYSSAISLSDMEIFIYPELLYSLVLANIMSPRIWAWREDKWFENIDKMTPYRRVQRLKQYIIDHYEFNLDLDTWGLTTKERELARFRPTMDEAAIAESNALFGYTGDKYYFDIDIRRHFGLDKYTTDTIPYWKTETVEAMDAFRFRDGYRRGAGECVSLSTLYAAALFVVCGIPLDKIYLMATPLHSQNFVDEQDGIITNNRRIVTKNMWFNGTELSARGQRALRNEQVTIVAHSTGYIHSVYPEATIDPAALEHFSNRLRAYLETDLSFEVLCNFLREHSRLQSCFQIEHEHHGHPRYIAAEKVYSYEHGSAYKVNGNTREKLLDEIDEYEFFAEPLEGRIPLNKFEDFFRKHEADVDSKDFQALLIEEFNCFHTRACDILRALKDFIKIEPRLPHTDGDRVFVSRTPIGLTPDMNRDEVLAYLESLRVSHPVADLAFYAYRDLGRTDWAPFMKAAIERNPVCVEATAERDDDAVVAAVEGMPNESIYDGPRLAQPDEVWNFGRGDGLEKAICLAAIWRARHPDHPVTISAAGGTASVTSGALSWQGVTSKDLAGAITL